MNVLIVTNHFWPEEFRINDLAIGLCERGHAVSVLTGIPNYPSGRFFTGYGFLSKNREFYRGIKITRVPLIPRGSGSAIRLALNYTSFALASCLLAPFLCRDNYDIILVFESSPVTVGLPALILKKLRRIPIVFWVQDLWPDSLSATGVIRSEMILCWIGHLVRFIYNRCDRILIQSRAFFDSVNSLASCPDRICYFPNTAEEIYRPIQLEPDAPEKAIVGNGFRIMFAGNIGDSQDFPTILQAANLLKNYSEIQWIIIGDGRRREWVEQQIITRGLDKSVHLLGRYPVEVMPRFYSLADVLLVSLKDEPIFSLTIPSKIQSYLACAKPLLACLNGEGARIVGESGAGIACPAGNPEQLATAALEMYQLTENARINMGNKGRDYFLCEFERNTLLQRIEKIMNEVIEHNKEEL